MLLTQKHRPSDLHMHVCTHTCTQLDKCKGGYNFFGDTVDSQMGVTVGGTDGCEERNTFWIHTGTVYVWI